MRFASTAIFLSGLVRTLDASQMYSPLVEILTSVDTYSCPDKQDGTSQLQGDDLHSQLGAMVMKPVAGCLFPLLIRIVGVGTPFA